MASWFRSSVTSVASSSSAPRLIVAGFFDLRLVSVSGTVRWVSDDASWCLFAARVNCPRIVVAASRLRLSALVTVAAVLTAFSVLVGVTAVPLVMVTPLRRCSSSAVDTSSVVTRASGASIYTDTAAGLPVIRLGYSSASLIANSPSSAFVSSSRFGGAGRSASRPRFRFSVAAARTTADALESASALRWSLLGGRESRIRILVA